MPDLTPRDLKVVMDHPDAILANLYKSKLDEVTKELECVKDQLNAAQDAILAAARMIGSLLAGIDLLLPTITDSSSVKDALKS